MKIATHGLTLLLGLCLLAQPARSQGGFREVLEIVGIKPAALEAVNPAQPTADDWQTIAQVIARLEQHASDLGRWSKTDVQLSASIVGEIVDVAGTVERVEKVAAPAGQEPQQLYRCQLELSDGHKATVLAVHVPERWQLDTSFKEPVSFRGVLLQADEPPLFLTTHFSWHPQEGIPAGQLLLARYGMDAALWDDIVQRTPFVSPERGREAQAFYATLATIAKVPAAELAAATLQAIAGNAAAANTDSGTNRERQIAALVVEQAQLGLSSAAPLFLNPQDQVGQLVRIEGTARRAVRIVADDPSVDQPIREYYELEVFTADSQNLPIVCLVTHLPAGFPVGDAVRAGVRLDGVFFKLWRYHSRKTETAGETATPQASYTPVVMAATVTWLKQASTPERWWGLAVGGIIFVLIMGWLLRIMFASHARIPSLKDETPDFSSLND